MLSLTLLEQGKKIRSKINSDKIVIALLFTASFCFEKLPCEVIDFNPFRKILPLSLFIRVFLRSKVSLDFLKHMFLLHMMLGSAGGGKGRRVLIERGVAACIPLS